MKRRLLVGAIALAMAMVAISSRSYAQIAIGNGGTWISSSFPNLGKLVYDEKTTVRHAGITLMVKGCETREGREKAVWTGGFVSFPANTNGLFPEFNYLRVSALVLGINPDDIRNISAEGSDEYTIGDNGDVIVNTENLRPGEYTLVYNVDQKSSRRDKRILFFIKKHEHITVTDTVGMIFLVTDPTKFVGDYCRRYEGTNSEEASKDCLALAKALYLEKEAGSFRLVSPMLPYNALQETSWRERQNLPRVLDPPVQSEPKVEKRELPAPSGLTDFTIKFVDRNGSAYKCSGLKIFLKASDGNVRTFSVTSSSPEFTGFSSGDYQFKFSIAGRGESGWSTIHVWPGVKPVRVTINN